MRKLIYSMMVSLDGFVARSNGDLDWVRYHCPKLAYSGQNDGIGHGN